MSAARFPKLNQVVLLCLLLVCPRILSAASGTNSTSSPDVAAQTDVGSNDVLRAYLELQQQIHETQLAIDRAQLQSEQAAAKNAEALTNRLNALEQALAAQRARDIEATQGTTRFMLMVLAMFAGIGFLAVMLSAYFQWRTVNRLTELSAALPASRGLNPLPSLAALDVGEVRSPGGNAGELPSGRLLGVIERLEKRILELEHTANALPNRAVAEIGENGASPDRAHEAATFTSSTGSDPAARTSELLQKGQSLLNEEKAEEALASFDEALAIEPNNAEALVKKGEALEKLRKPQEAIECYDRAIAADNSMTIAYLHKGGLCNRLERFNEAMECYEQALRTQESRRAG